MPIETGSAVGWEGGGALDVGKNLFETVSLSLSEMSSCRKSKAVVIMEKIKVKDPKGFGNL
ncbi:MAG: hypothetical protein Q8L87_13850 [Anaerolineales bacterium]|nr:hypothetical protein [Anaerolineales bacterium]